MKNKRTITISAITVTLAIIATFVVFRDTQPVKAQNQPPPPEVDRISFGIVGITAGQTMRVNVSNIVATNDSVFPPGSSRVAFIVIGSRGQLVRNRSGQVIRKVVQLERGDSAFLDLDFDELPPGTIRQQLRAVVTVQYPPGPTDQQLPPGPYSLATVEIINNANGRSQFAMFTNPAVIRGFNPQPDPPIE